MTTKQFHLGDILTVTHDRLVAPDGIGAIYRLLNYMTGDNLFTHQLPRAADECKPWLLRQHPQLGGPDVDRAAAQLGAELDGTAPDGPARGQVVGEWLAAMVARYSETLPVEPIPADDHDRIDPLEELRGMVGADRIIVVDGGGETD